jgi:cysteinyl-tRNA synthetase
MEASGGAADPGLVEALCDDLNTPQAIAYLHETARRGDGGTVRASLALMGFAFDLADPRRIEIDEGRVRSLVERRSAVRAAKDWAESDRLRDELLGMGVVVKDNKDGTTTWEVKR